jgi:hypothetical protein
MIHPTEGKPNTLQTVADTMGLHVSYSRLDVWENAYRASLTPQQLLDYRVHNGELAEQCPRCGARYVVIESQDFPDMVGTTYAETYTCCGTINRWNSAIEYRNGIAVDMH